MHSFKFCPCCGASVAMRIPEGDSLPRHICSQCHTIHYQNPRIIVGCLPVHEEQVLLCKRAIEPRYGYWTLPAGFMENQESAEEGALRETYEEARARVEIGQLHTIFSIPHINQVYLIYYGKLTDLDFEPGPESLEVKLVNPAEIPWDEIAFTSIKFALEQWVQNGNREGQTARGEFRK